MMLLLLLFGLYDGKRKKRGSVLIKIGNVFAPVDSIDVDVNDGEKNERKAHFPNTFRHDR